MPRVLIVADDGLMRQGLRHSKPAEPLPLRSLVYQELPIGICSPYSPREQNSAIPMALDGVLRAARTLLCPRCVPRSQRFPASLPVLLKQW